MKFDFTTFKITKREILFSIIIVMVMLLIGFFINSKINDNYYEKIQEYSTALQIDNDKDLFKHGMRTNIGNAFIYGDLRVVDTVSYPEIKGEYSYIKKVKEKYTKHNEGKKEYWQWEEVKSWSKHSKRISFLGVKFDYGKINLTPDNSYLGEYQESPCIRYSFYGTKAIFTTGTLYAELGDNTINNTSFYDNKDIEETMRHLNFNSGLIIFWILWIIFIGAIVFAFYYIDNKWLEDKVS